MKKLTYTILLAFAACFTMTGCKDDFSGDVEAQLEEGTYTMCFSMAGGHEIETRADDGKSPGDERIENALVFAFDKDGKCVAKQWSNLNESKSMEMYLPAGAETFKAVCNLMDPEAVMDNVSTLDDLNGQAVVIAEPDGAYKGKFVMSDIDGGKEEQGQGTRKTVNFTMQRLAAKFEVTVKFTPEIETDKFMLSSISLHNVPKGSWIYGKTPELVEGKTEGTPDDPIVKTLNGGDKADYVYSDEPVTMKGRYFESALLDWEEMAIDNGTKAEPSDVCKMAVKTSFNLYENRRGQLDNTEEGYSYNWPKLDGSSDDNKSNYSQFWKKELAAKAGFEYASYLEIKGVYQGTMGKSEVSYYVYLGGDNFSNYDVCRNTRYNMEVTIRTIDKTDTRVDANNLEDIKVFYNSEEILDTHFNSVQTLVYSPSKWEMWVEEPDKHPWVELSMSEDYEPYAMGGGFKKPASSRLKGDAGMMYVYIHTDEYVPVIESPGQNFKADTRYATIKYRSTNKPDKIESFTVSQYPAQMVVLHIDYDVHTMEEVRDTFYIERIQEKKNLKWGFLHYWSFITDDLIASGTWDGLSNTRKLFDVAMKGDKWGVEPAYPEGVIPSDVALASILEKNRDRNGNGQIDYNEIVWYMPAFKELQALHEALKKMDVKFEGTADYFYSSTPSSADQGGVTPGFAYYVKMANGKKGIAQRDNEYSVIAMRRKNAWKGQGDANAEGDIEKDENIDYQEVIMPKY